MDCNHKTVPPLKSGVLSVALMVEYVLYNEAVEFLGYKNCFGCWLQESSFNESYPNVTKQYLKSVS